MIALQHLRPLRVQGHDLIEHPTRVSAITHQVTQKGVAVYTLRLGVRQTGTKRLPVGVQV